MRGLRLGISGQYWNNRTCICLAWLRRKRKSESLNELLLRVVLHLRIYHYSISYDIEKDTNVFACVFDVMYSCYGFRVVPMVWDWMLLYQV